MNRTQPSSWPVGPTRLRLMAVTSLTAIAVTLAGCSMTGTDPGDDHESSSSEGNTTVQVVTHDSFNVDEELLDQFEAETGYTLEYSAPGDAGTLVNQLILTKDSPLGDVVFGVDNAYAMRAVNEEIFSEYVPADLPDSADEHRIGSTLTPIDRGDVCMNVDHEWFSEHDLAEPATLDDLADPEYAELMVVSDPSRSSPGLAFLLATIGEFGDDWVEYWQDLLDGGMSIVDSWSDVYYTDFTGTPEESESGTRPIALSYSTSPAVTLDEDGESTTGALMDTCFRQVEYAGVLQGAQNPEGAEAFIDFLLSADVQADLPEEMFMYPIDDSIDLPESWQDHAPLADDPIEVDPARIETDLDAWLRTWQEQVLG